MFDRIFGKYLFETGFLSKEQLLNVYEKQDENRVKLGLLAVTEKLMTAEQALEVNRLQATMDKRFGDIALEKGYLTLEQLSNLLGHQGNVYLTFIQTLLDCGHFTMEQLDHALQKYEEEHHYTGTQMDSLTSCDINEVMSVLMDGIPEEIQDITGVMLRTMSRLIDRHVYVEKVYRSDYYAADQLSSQALHGEHQILSSLCGNEEAMKSTAIGYMGEQFIVNSEDALDSLSELINCVNGLYATYMSSKNVSIDLSVPEYKMHGATIQGKSLYVVRIMILGQQLDYIISYDCTYDVVDGKSEKEGNIFIVDDSRTARKVLSSILEMQGYKIVGEAENGEEALDRIPESGADLITLDITMPLMDGIETLKKLKEQGVETPIMMVSASAQREKIMEALKSGACDFLQKPYDENQVIEAVEKALEA
ncbi:MAG: response regulator [Lachnospiraceae bacterium]|nr:response regulator [Lachnospiraceae bacterium]